MNSDLRADEIRTQIMELHNAGYETIFLHARAGLKTPYLSQDWFDANGAILCKWCHSIYANGANGAIL